MRFKNVFLLLLLLAHAPSTARGQEWFADDTIRVWKLTPQTEWYGSGGGVSSMPIVNVEGLASAGLDHRWGGARLGGFVGGVLGALTAFLMFEPEFIVRECNADRSICGSGDQVRQVNSSFIESLKGAVPGILIGGTLGWFIGRRIPTETLEPQIATRDGALLLGFRIRR